MVKRIALVLLVALLLLAALVARFFMPSTGFPEAEKLLYIRTGATDKQAVLDSLTRNQIIRHPRSFELLASRMNTWNKIRPGRYSIRQGMSLYEISRLLRSGEQAPFNLTIPKLRLPEQLAALVGRHFETDSAAMMDFLKRSPLLDSAGLDSTTVLLAVFPDTYQFFWTASPEQIFRRLQRHAEQIWNESRLAKAEQLGLEPRQVQILASIIEEETNYHEEKPLMASVYINRLRRGMPLGADPTVKFALGDFSLRRIYHKHLAVTSPYNTYRNKGLPPGPICTPSLISLDAVLSAPQTDYLFFVAKQDFSQGHVFTTNYRDHLRHARAYQQALNQRQRGRNAKIREESLE